MTIFTKAKELITMTYNLSENWPKKYRFDLTSRVCNIAIDIYEKLVEANEIYIDTKHLVVKNSVSQDNLPVNKNVELNFLALKLFEIYKINEWIVKRRYKQNRAFAELKKLDFLFTEAHSRHLISTKKWERISGLISETTHLLKAWIKSDQKRFGF